jgi:hypothetical protein
MIQKKKNAIISLAVAMIAFAMVIVAPIIIRTIASNAAQQTFDQTGVFAVITSAGNTATIVDIANSQKHPQRQTFHNTFEIPHRIQMASGWHTVTGLHMDAFRNMNIENLRLPATLTNIETRTAPATYRMHAPNGSIQNESTGRDYDNDPLNVRNVEIYNVAGVAVPGFRVPQLEDGTGGNVSSNVIVPTMASRIVIFGASNAIIPNNITEIGQNAFVGRRELSEINIPGSIRTIHETAFAGAPNIEKFHIEEINWSSNLQYWSEAGALWRRGSGMFGASGATLVRATKNLDHVPLILNGNTHQIGFGAFSGNLALTDVVISSEFTNSTGNTIQGSNTFVRSAAFAGTTNLTKMTFLNIGGSRIENLFMTKNNEIHPQYGEMEVTSNLRELEFRWSSSGWNGSTFSGAFAGNARKLESVKFIYEDGVNQGGIGHRFEQGSFVDCFALTNIDMSETFVDWVRDGSFGFNQVGIAHRGRVGQADQWPTSMAQRTIRIGNFNTIASGSFHRQNAEKIVLGAGGSIESGAFNYSTIDELEFIPKWDNPATPTWTPTVIWNISSAFQSCFINTATAKGNVGNIAFGAFAYNLAPHMFAHNMNQNITDITDKIGTFDFVVEGDLNSMHSGAFEHNVSLDTFHVKGNFTNMGEGGGFLNSGLRKFTVDGNLTMTGPGNFIRIPRFTDFEVGGRLDAQNANGSFTEMHFLSMYQTYGLFWWADGRPRNGGFIPWLHHEDRGVFTWQPSNPANPFGWLIIPLEKWATLFNFRVGTDETADDRSASLPDGAFCRFSQRNHDYTWNYGWAVFPLSVQQQVLGTGAEQRIAHKPWVTIGDFHIAGDLRVGTGFMVDVWVDCLKVDGSLTFIPRFSGSWASTFERYVGESVYIGGSFNAGTAFVDTSINMLEIKGGVSTPPGAFHRFIYGTVDIGGNLVSNSAFQHARGNNLHVRGNVLVDSGFDHVDLGTVRVGGNFVVDGWAYGNGWGTGTMGIFQNSSVLRMCVGGNMVISDGAFQWALFGSLKVGCSDPDCQDCTDVCSECGADCDGCGARRIITVCDKSGGGGNIISSGMSGGSGVVIPAPGGSIFVQTAMRDLRVRGDITTGVGSFGMSNMDSLWIGGDYTGAVSSFQNAAIGRMYVGGAFTATGAGSHVAWCPTAQANVQTSGSVMSHFESFSLHIMGDVSVPDAFWQSIFNEEVYFGGNFTAGNAFTHASTPKLTVVGDFDVTANSAFVGQEATFERTGSTRHRFSGGAHYRRALPGGGDQSAGALRWELAIAAGYGPRLTMADIDTRYIGIPEIYIGGDVTQIGAGSFSHIPLEKLTIVGDVGEIGNGAFHNAIRLRELNIGGSIGPIGDGAFTNLFNLKSINFGTMDNNGNLISGGDIASIGDGAFGNMISLTELRIPGNVGSIGDYAFHNCLSLQRLHFPKATTVGEGVFINIGVNNIDRLVEVYMPVEVQELGAGAFTSMHHYEIANVGNMGLIEYIYESWRAMHHVGVEGDRIMREFEDMRDATLIRNPEALETKLIIVFPYRRVDLPVGFVGGLSPMTEFGDNWVDMDLVDLDVIQLIFIEDIVEGAEPWTHMLAIEVAMSEARLEVGQGRVSQTLWDAFISALIDGQALLVRPGTTSADAAEFDAAYTRLRDARLALFENPVDGFLPENDDELDDELLEVIRRGRGVTSPEQAAEIAAELRAIQMNRIITDYTNAWAQLAALVEQAGGILAQPLANPLAQYFRDLTFHRGVGANALETPATSVTELRAAADELRAAIDAANEAIGNETGGLGLGSRIDVIVIILYVVAALLALLIIALVVYILLVTKNQTKRENGKEQVA